MKQTKFLSWMLCFALAGGFMAACSEESSEEDEEPALIKLPYGLLPDNAATEAPAFTDTTKNVNIP